MALKIGQWLATIDAADSNGLSIRVACHDKRKVSEIESGQGDGGEGDQLALCFTSEGIEEAYQKNGDPKATSDLSSQVKRDIWEVEFLRDSDYHLNVYIKNDLGAAVRWKLFRTIISIDGAPTLRIDIALAGKGGAR